MLNSVRLTKSLSQRPIFPEANAAKALESVLDTIQMFNMLLVRALNVECRIGCDEHFPDT
jgi:hypothetical protein